MTDTTPDLRESLRVIGFRGRPRVLNNGDIEINLEFNRPPTPDERTILEGFLNQEAHQISFKNMISNLDIYNTYRPIRDPGWSTIQLGYPTEGCASFRLDNIEDFGRMLPTFKTLVHATTPKAREKEEKRQERIRAAEEVIDWMIENIEFDKEN